jgi:HEAT repeat protein
MDRRCFSLVAWCGLAAMFLQPPLSVRGAAGDDPAADEDLLEAAGFASDGPALLEFFQRRSLPEADREAVLQKLVEQLGDKRSKQRKKAAAELVGHGAAAVEVLKAAVEGDNREVRERARACLNKIDKGISQYVTVAAARLLALRRPDGAAAALFAYLPHAGADWVREEILLALAGVAVRQGKPDPLLAAGLRDKVPSRRADAAYLLARMGGAGQRAAIRRLLDDPDALVRQRVAQGLAGAANLADEPTEADEALLKANKVDSDGPGLLAYFQKRSLTGRDRKRLQELVQQLGARQFRKRKQATEELVLAGTPALRYLKPALKHEDIEVARRAALCVARIERGPGTALPTAAVRVLVKLAPEETVKTLLHYVPSADDEDVEKTVVAGLCALAVRAVDLDPAFAAALRDPEPARRAAAAYVLGRAGLAEECQAVKRLFSDPDAKVRLRAAQGLLFAQEKAAVPVFLKLLDLDSEKQVRDRAEEALRRLALDQAPSDSVAGDSVGERQKARTAWAAWWRAHEKDLDLARPNWDAGQRGLTLVCEFDGGVNGRGQAWEFGRDGQSRRKLDNLAGPMDAEVLPGNKFLVVESNPSRISERDLKGNILWQLQISSPPIACQRLADGNTFLATPTNLIEIDREQEEVYNHNREEDGRISSAYKARNGHVVYITDVGRVVEFDPRGEGTVVYRFSVGNPGGMCGVEWLPNGRYLVALSGPGKIMEVDRSGKPAWEISVAGVHQALRLPSGNFLVASLNTKKLAEVNPAGKILWEKQTLGRPWRVHRR